jgi:hypothetical protein
MHSSVSLGAMAVFFDSYPLSTLFEVEQLRDKLDFPFTMSAQSTENAKFFSNVSTIFAFAAVRVNLALF